MKLYTAKGKKGLPEEEELFCSFSAKSSCNQCVDTKIEPRTGRKNQEDLFRKMELPLSIILAEMEISGIKVDATRLQEMKGEFSARLREIEQKSTKKPAKNSI